jgi:hypothetical protein
MGSMTCAAAPRLVPRALPSPAHRRLGSRWLVGYFKGQGLLSPPLRKVLGLGSEGPGVVELGIRVGPTE